MKAKRNQPENYEALAMMKTRGNYRPPGRTDARIASLD